MKEIKGNLWTHQGTSIIAITTNGIVKANGTSVMGRGCALECAQSYPDIPLILGTLVKKQGNHCHALPHQLVSFPTKNNWRDPSDLALIEQSAREVVALADLHRWESIVIPRPGCNNGRLQWSTVKQVLEPILDDRFAVISF